MKTKHFVLHSVYWVWYFQGYGACRRTTAFVGLFGKGSVLAEFCSFYFVSFFDQCIQRCIDVVSAHSTVKDLLLSTELSYMPSPFRNGPCKIVLWPKSIIPVDWCTNAPAAGVDFRGCHLSCLLFRLGRIPGNIGDLDIVKFVLADSLESIVVWGEQWSVMRQACRAVVRWAMLTDTPDNSEQAKAGKGILEEIWAAGANQSGTLT